MELEKEEGILRNKIQQAAFKNGTRQNDQEKVSTNIICIGFSYNDREYMILNLSNDKMLEYVIIYISKIFEKYT